MSRSRQQQVKLPALSVTRRQFSPSKQYLVMTGAPTAHPSQASKRLKLGSLQPSQDILTNLIAARGEKELLQQLVRKKELTGFRAKKKPMNTTIYSVTRAERTFSQAPDTSFDHHTNRDLNSLIEVNHMPNGWGKYKPVKTNHQPAEEQTPTTEAANEGRQVSQDFKQAKSYKLADLDEIIAEGLQRDGQAPTVTLKALRDGPPTNKTSPIKTVVIKPLHPKDDSFVMSTQGTAAVVAALAVFRQDYSMKAVQTHLKEATLIMGSDFGELEIPHDYQSHLMKLGITMLRCELYPSVYFVSGIWKNMFHLIIKCIKAGAVDKETLAQLADLMQTLRFYCKTEKLDPNTEIPAFLNLFHSAFHELKAGGLNFKQTEENSVLQLLKLVVSGFVSFLGWALKLVDNSLSADHSFTSVDELPSVLRNPHLNSLSYDTSFECVDLAFSVFTEPDAIVSPVSLDNLRNHVSSLLFKHQISDLGKSGGNSSTMFWCILIFQLILILMQKPQTAGAIIERWMSPADTAVDMELIESSQRNKEEDTMLETYLGLTMPERQYGSQINYFLDLLIRFTTSIFRDQGKFVRTYSILIQRMDKFLEALPRDKTESLTRIEKDLLCRLNVLIFEAIKDIKHKMLGLIVAPFIKALVICSINIVERSDMRDRKTYFSLVKNGFYEIIQLFQKPKMLQTGHPGVEEMQTTIIALLTFFRKHSV